MNIDVFSTNDEKLQHYATIAIQLEKRLDCIMGRGAFTAQSLTPQFIQACINSDREYQALNESWIVAQTPALPQKGSISNFPANIGNKAPPMLRFLSLICDLFLPLHPMFPLAEQIRRSAITWYISGNTPDGIQVRLSSFQQFIENGNKTGLQYTWPPTQQVSLPSRVKILSVLRIIFRILNLYPDDGKESYLPVFLFFLRNPLNNLPNQIYE